MNALRSFVFALLLAATTGVIGLLGLPLALFGRSASRQVSRAWAASILFFARIVWGVRWRVEGEEHIPSGGAIVAGNHQSMWETVAIYVLLRRPAVVFKRELLRIPVYGLWGLATGGIPIDRDGGAQSLRALQRRCAERIGEGDAIVVFPEGTRRPVGDPGELQPGIAGIYLAANAPCVPFVHNSGTVWLHPGPLKKAGVITIRFLPAIPAGLKRREFMSALTAALHTRVEPTRAAIAADAQSERAKA